MTSETIKTERYTPSAIEPKWQAHWDATRLHETPDDSDKPNYYFVTMFPYPSGDLHVGLQILEAALQVILKRIRHGHELHVLIRA